MTNRAKTATPRKPASGPAGIAIRHGADGPQLLRSTGKRWTAAAEARFLDNLAASCNVRASAKACGFDLSLMYRKKRADAAFAQRWQAALEQGYVRIEMALVERTVAALEGWAPDPETPIPEMTVKDALAVLAQHRAAVLRVAGGKRRWARPRTLDEMRESILGKLEAIERARLAQAAVAKATWTDPESQMPTPVVPSRSAGPG